jgi:hypothetical protein
MRIVLALASALVVCLIGLAEAREAPAPRTTVLPAGTAVVVGLARDLVSGEAQRGDLVPIVLARAVQADGVTLLPAGTPGVAEVVHAEPIGDWVRGGELMVAARYLETDGRRIPIRGAPLAAKGRETFRTGPGSMIWTGWEAILRRGAATEAELTADFDLGRDLGVQAAPPRRIRRLPDALVQPPPGKAQIVFFHPKTEHKAWRGFKLRSGPGKGEPIGELPRGVAFVLKTDPGRREFTGTTDFQESLILDLEPGETYYVRAVVGIGKWTGHPDLMPSTREEFEAAEPGLTWTMVFKTWR